MADPPITPESFAALQKSIQSALIATTRTTSALCAEDLPFQRSLDTSFAQELDRQNARLLALADRLLGRAALVADVSASAPGSGAEAKSKFKVSGREVRAPRLRNADELDGNWRAVVDVVDSLLERTDGVLDEVRGVIKKGVDAAIIPDAEARKLPYLQACINEGLRMYPPVTGLLSKQSPDAGDVITVAYPDGSSKEVHLPPNVKIGWNPYGLLRSRTLFGSDAEIWRPERWLEGAAPPAKLRDMNEAVGLVFGYGRFGCLGRPVAVMELNKAVPELMRRFRWQIARPEKPYGGICAGFWLHEKMDFVVRERGA